MPFETGTYFGKKICDWSNVKYYKWPYIDHIMLSSGHTATYLQRRGPLLRNNLAAAFGS